MSQPEVWGPAVWRLFHTLSERLNDNAYNALSRQLFGFFVRICKFLPCPDCSNDASIFLAKIRFSDIKNKIEFKNTFYLFHNWVNAKKRKPLFNYGNINNYSKYRLVDVLNDFYAKYQTKGNMKLLTESFQRQFVVKDFNNWIKYTIAAFVPRINIPQQLPGIIVEEPVQEEPVQEEPVATIEEEPVVIEEPVATIEEEPVVTIEEEPVVTIETPITEDESFGISEEQVILEQPIVKSKKSKKSKSKK
jgi:sulfur relay (sulfurtransferase) DsrC/TusE family protein